MVIYFFKSIIYYNFVFFDGLFGLYYFIFKNIFLGGILFFLNSKIKSYLLIIFIWNENFKLWEKYIDEIFFNENF